MSEASRSSALAHAVAHHATTDSADKVLATASVFHDFIAGNDKQPGPTTATKPATKPAVAKPATKPAPVEVADDDAAGEEVTKEQVAESIDALITGDKRDEAVALLKKYGAKSISTLKPKDYAAVVEAAAEMLSGDDLTS